LLISPGLLINPSLLVSRWEHPAAQAGVVLTRISQAALIFVIGFFRWLRWAALMNFIRPVQLEPGEASQSAKVALLR